MSKYNFKNLHINSKKKICFLVDSLSFGGAERIAAILSNIFSNWGYNVLIISIKDKITYSFSGELINLGENNSSIKFIKQFQKLIKLRRALIKANPDYIIDFRMRNRVFMELMIYVFALNLYRRKIIFTIHNYHIDWHLPKCVFLRRVYTKEKIVAVSKAIKNSLEDTYNFKNVTYIPNTLDFQRTEKNVKILDITYVVAVGSLINEKKQFDKLINTYFKSNLPKRGIMLYILGKGVDRPQLKTQIEELGLNNHVKLLGFKQNVYEYISNAKFLVLCSRVEGFPMVLLESLTLNTPVVSFNCKSGPSELIVDRENGLLVKDQDFNALKIAMEEFVTDDNLYTKCKRQTHITLDRFKSDIVLQKWQQLLK